MSLSPSVLDALLAAGATAEMIVAAVKAAGEEDLARAAHERDAEDARKARQREQNNERQRRHRERNAPSRVTSVSHSDDPLSLPPNEINSNPPAHTPAMAAPARKGFPIPEGVTAEQWASFTAQRKKKLNDRAYGLLCGKLVDLARAGWPPGEMIDRAIEHGWETVFAPKELRNGNRPANDRPDEFQNSTIRAGAAREAGRRAGSDYQRSGPSALFS